MAKAPDSETRKPFETFRGAEARDYGEHNIQAIVDPSPAVLGAFGQFSGYDQSGTEVKLVYARPGFSLTSVWFKSGYPLALHSHSGGCLYYIVAGSIRIGEELFGAGDGFFVDHDVPYTYETGPDGVEVLEFRATDELDIRFRANTKVSWDRILGKLGARQSAWDDEVRPSESARRRRVRSSAPMPAVKARRKAQKARGERPA
ncbi:MAG: cupin domain-containing protein [Sphingomonadales bacterium]|nr:cupin domain-containing protein [Sphingomonadales bacterium]